MEEVENIWREAAMAATPLLQPNFQPKSVSQAQLQKLQELRRRRIQIKKNSSNLKMMKGKSHGDRTNMAGEFSTKKDISQTEQEKSAVQEKSCQCTNNEDANTISKSQKQDVPFPWKKRQKLHWGLDTKERWERKGNM